MFPTAMFEDSSSSGTRVHHHDLSALNNVISTVSLHHHQQPQKIKKKRGLPGNPDPDAEVIALSPKTLLATNRYVCEICHKGFQREQNLQLHRRGHNLPWKLKQRSTSNKEVVVKKKAYVCPEPSCVHHNPSRALGDLTGIKKHYCRKHGEKKWKCEKCSKVYAVQSDWKAHSKTCGTKEYRCDCGSIFSRKDSFMTHRAFCDALAEETERLAATQIAAATAAATNPLLLHSLFLFPTNQHSFQTSNYFSPWNSSSSQSHQNPNPNINSNNFQIKPEPQTFHVDPTTTTSYSPLTLLQQLQNHNVRRLHHAASSNAATSATALLQMAATVGAISTTTSTGPAAAAAAAASSSVMGHVTRLSGMDDFGSATQQLDSVMMGMRPDQQQQQQLVKSEHHRLTRDFLGLTAMDANVNRGVVDVSMNVKDMLRFTEGTVENHQNQAHHIPQQQQRFGFFGINSSTAPDTWGN